jgi:N-acetylglucosamine-6-phosphate deacetylase
VIVSAARALLPDGDLHEVWMEIESGIVTDLGSGQTSDSEIHLSGVSLPGFVDIHCHGGAGGYFASGNPKDIESAIALHRSHGTSALFASLVSAPIDELLTSIKKLLPYVKNGALAGIHLEGPYLSPEKRGAHDAMSLRHPVNSEIETLIRVGEGAIRMITIAPELPGSLEAMKYLKSHGVVVAMGHTNATKVLIESGIAAGSEVITHFNNAMPKLHSNAEDVPQYILENSGLYLELIADGVHVTAGTMKEVLLDRGDRVILVTDAMSAAGCSDGDYMIGNYEVEVSNSVARIKGTQTLAGSTLTMDQSFLNLLDMGLDLKDAVAMSSTNAARLMGLTQQGSIAIGMRADFVEYDPAAGSLRRISL